MTYSDENVSYDSFTECDTGVASLFTASTVQPISEVEVVAEPTSSGPVIDESAPPVTTEGESGPPIDLDLAARKIEHLKASEAANLLEIGQVLNAAKQEIKGENQKWLEFLRDPRVDLHPRQAQRHMRLASAPDGAVLAKLGIKKADLLLRLDSDQRQKLMAEQDLTKLSAEELKPFVGSATPRPTATSPKIDFEPEFIWHLGVLHIGLDQAGDLTVPTIDDAHEKLLRMVHYQKHESRLLTQQAANTATELVDQARRYLLQYLERAQLPKAT